jgi:hypothetical protein
MLEGDESTFQQKKHDPNKIMKLAEEDWDQSDFPQWRSMRFLLRPIFITGCSTGNNDLRYVSKRFKYAPKDNLDIN